MNQCSGLCNLGQGIDPIEGIDLGCMNGAGHTWVLMSPTIMDAFAKCAVPSIPENVRQGCYHGIGHGLRERYGADMQTAVSQCLLLPNDEAKYQCSHAIFMEPPLGASSGISTNLLTFCNELPVQVGESCFEFIGSMEYARTRDTHVAIEICDRVPTPFQLRCRYRVGEILYVSRLAVVDIQYCMNMNINQSMGCIRGFIRTTIDEVNDIHGDHAIHACAALPEASQKYCYSVTGEILLLRYGESIRQRACKTIASNEFSQACAAAQVSNDE
jgi:hypothetical protein